MHELHAQRAFTHRPSPASSTWEAALTDARTKDAAVDPGTLAWVLSQWRLGPNVPMPPGISLDAVERMRTQRIERLLALAVPHE